MRHIKETKNRDGRDEKMIGEKEGRRNEESEVKGNKENKEQAKR